MCPSVRCECSIPVAERLDLSAVEIAQIVAHTVASPFAAIRGGAASLQMTLERTFY